MITKYNKMADHMRIIAGVGRHYVLVPSSNKHANCYKISAYFNRSMVGMQKCHVLA